MEDENSSDLATAGVSKGVKGRPAAGKRSGGVQQPHESHDPGVSQHQVPKENQSVGEVDAVDELGEDSGDGDNDGKDIRRRG